MKTAPPRLVILLASGVVLTACGGGGSSTGASLLNTSATGTTSSTGSTSSSSGTDSSTSTSTSVIEGTIDGFGSVVIDGVHYDVEGAEILHGEDPLTEGDLEVGEVVRLIAEVSSDGTATASTVYRRRDLEGPIESLDLAGNTLTLFGRTIQVDPETRFSPAIIPNDMSGLALTQRVEVSGVTLNDGTLLATFITLDDDNQNAVRGQITDLDEGARTFVLGATTIDYGNASLDDDFGGEAPQNGDWVTVKSLATPVGGVLEASELDLDREGAGAHLSDLASVPAGADVLLRGRVTSALAAGTFSVDGQDVQLGTATQFEGGTESDIDLDDGIVVAGSLNDDGSIAATAVRFATPMNFEVEGLVSNLAPLTVAGVEVALTTDTQLFDESSVGKRFFAPSDLQVGDFLEVRGNYDGSVLTARRVERGDEDNDDGGRVRLDDDESDDFRFDEADDDEWKIKGAITALNATEVSVRGLTARFAPGTRYELGDVLVDQARFLAEVAVGDPAELETLRLADGSLVVSEIEREFHRSQSFLDFGTRLDDDSFGSDDSLGSDDSNSSSDDGDDSSDDFEGAGDDGRFGDDDFGERDDDGIEVKGLVSEASASGVTVGGVAYRFDANTRYKAFDQRMTQSLFLSYLRTNDLVEVDYTVDSAGNRIVLKIKIDD